MNIKEAEKLTGVSSRNIRFYEQKGLLNPVRNKENDYREYSDEDIHTLMLIRALRMLDMPLEQIREVLEGKLSLQTAAAQQREKLKAQIEKMETTVRFCEELAKEENPDIEALLTRMDEPENREMLSKKWSTDHAETLETALTALVSGLLPVVLGFVLGFPMLIALMIHESAMLMLSLLLPVVWICLGCYFHGRGRWWLNLILAHLVPALLCGLMEWQLQLPYQQRAEWCSEVGISMKTALMYFTTTTEIIQGFWPILWLLMGCFCLGGFLSWLIPIFKTGWAAIYADKKVSFWRKLLSRLPVKGILIATACVLPLFIIIGNIMFGPVPSYLKPESLEKRLTSGYEVCVETDEISYELERSAEFADCFCLEEWERSYLGTVGPEIVAQVHLSHDRSEPFVIVLYDNGTVKVYESWITTKEAYYHVPDDVAQAVLEYAKKEGTAQPVE